MLPACVRRAPVALLSVLAVLAAGLVAAAPAAQAVSANLVISQVYGGGGNLNATYTHDYVEIFNRGTTDVSIDDFSLQYASATGTGNFGNNSTAVTELPDAVLQPGEFFLVQEAGGTTGSPLPGPDHTDPSPINMSGTAGKVALVTGDTTLGCNGGSTPCGPAALARIVDLIGYGNANFFEGAAAPTISNTLADFRKVHGCQDTDNNADDFEAATPEARTTTTTRVPCEGPPPEDEAPTVTGTSPVNGATDVPAGSNLTVSFSEPVDADEASFALNCSASGDHPASVAGDTTSTTYTLDPETDFTADESCSLTVIAAEVSDLDGDDPPDTMAANSTTSFRVAGLGPCESTPTHEIGAVQGDGAATPIPAGQQVTVRGVVVGDLPSFSGFYLQDADGDGNAATSDGIFVFRSGAAVSLGDEVAVRGTVSEFNTVTQVSPTSSNVEVCSDTPGPLPAPALLDLPASDEDREPFEAMLVAPADVLMVSEVFDLTSFGELMLSEGGLLVQPTELARPGSAEAAAIAAANVERRIILDDGLSPRVTVTTRPYLSPTTPVRVGDKLTFTAPTVLSYAFGNWRLQPSDGTAEGTFAPQNTRQAAPDAVGGDMQVAAFNVLNYFLTLTGPDARGATTPEAFEKQAAKIVPAIEALGAEVVTLMEIEDTASTAYGPEDPDDNNADEALADLVRRLNLAAGYDKWSYSPMPDELLVPEVDRDVIRNGIIYQNDVVQPVGDPVGLVDEDIWFNAREPIAQTFAKDGDRFTVVANHFKSKSPGAPTGDNKDTGDGQGQWNGDRKRQAASLATFTEQLRADTGDQDVLIMGDLNAYTQEDPIEVLRSRGFTDLGSQLDPDRYSYVFDDMSGSLDHGMATAALTAKITDVAHWNINAVESFAYQYVGDPALYAPNQYRSSDHDPLVLGIDLEERCNGLLPTIKGNGTDQVLTGTNKSDVIMGLGGTDVIDGAGGEDTVCGGAGNDSLRGGNGGDYLNGGFGDDTLLGDRGDDRLVGGPGTDVLDGGFGTDSEEQEGAES